MAQVEGNVGRIFWRREISFTPFLWSSVDYKIAFDKASENLSVVRVVSTGYNRKPGLELIPGSKLKIDDDMKNGYAREVSRTCCFACCNVNVYRWLI